jgi:hypothetical protein
MALQQSIRKKSSLYDEERYWYHLSSTLNRKTHRLVPWGNSDGMNRSDSEPSGKRICVAPSVAHCLTALPYCLSETYTVYRTKDPVIAKRSHGVFDANVTKEGWIETPTVFVNIGTLSLEKVEKGEKLDNVISESASGEEPRYSGKVYKWWSKINLEKYIKPPLTKKKKSV